MLEWIVENALTCKHSGRFFSDLQSSWYIVSAYLSKTTLYTQYWELIFWAFFFFTRSSCFLCLYYWFRENHLVNIECSPKWEGSNMQQVDREGYNITGIIKTLSLHCNLWFVLSYLKLILPSESYRGRDYHPNFIFSKSKHGGPLPTCKSQLSQD